MFRIPLRLLLLLSVLPAAFWSGCSDSGSDNPINPPPAGPSVTSLLPARTVVGDVVEIRGTGFGTAQGTSRVLFHGSTGTLPGSVVSGQWSDTRIQVEVPAGTAEGPVVIETGAGTSNSRTFSVAPRAVTFREDVAPILNAECAQCHTGTSPQAGLNAVTREGLLSGGLHGPAVLPRNSGGSNLVLKLRPTPPFGARMPQDGPPFLNDAQILTIADWIDQGAQADAAPLAPVITALDPSEGSSGDAIEIVGTNFGSVQEESVVQFTAASGVVAAQVSNWSDESITVTVPEDAISGTVQIVRSGREPSNTRLFTVVVVQLVSFRDDVIPVFQRHGCASCHGGINNLYVTPHASLMAGTSTHGPVILPGNSAQSVLILKMTNPPFGVLMPQGATTPVASSDIETIARWIDQGAQDH